MFKGFGIGRFTSDPKIQTLVNRTTNEQFNQVKFCLACRRGAKHTEFISILVRNGLVETIAKNCKKGTMIAFEGDEVVPPYDKINKKRYEPYIILREFEFCDANRKDHIPANVPADVPEAPPGTEDFELIDDADLIYNDENV